MLTDDGAGEVPVVCSWCGDALRGDDHNGVRHLECEPMAMVHYDRDGGVPVCGALGPHDVAEHSMRVIARSRGAFCQACSDDLTMDEWVSLCLARDESTHEDH